MRDKTITEQTFDQRTQAKRVAEASVAAQEAAVRQAELDLQFTELKAPVAGRIGDRRVSPGNLVTGGTGGNTTLLATIVSIDPMRFEFTFDEASYLRYERIARRGCGRREPRQGCEGLASSDRRAGFRARGHGRFRRQRRSTAPAARSAAARRFPNPKGLFTPGMFARVRVPGSLPYDALLVPDAAIASEQVRKYVMVVGADNTVTPKYVTLGQLVGQPARDQGWPLGR